MNEEATGSEPSLMVQLRLGELEIDSENYPVAIYELNGNPKFIKYSKQFLGVSHVIIFFFDVTDLGTLEVLKKYWFSCIEQYMINAVKHSLQYRVIFVGNKIDLLSSKVKRDMLKRIRGLIGWPNVPVFLISARTGENVEKMFVYLKKLLKERIIPVLRNMPRSSR